MRKPINQVQAKCWWACAFLEVLDMRDIEKMLAKISNLNPAIENALEHEVADEARLAIKDAAEERVYEAYKPRFYSRRKEDGGLIGPNNILCQVSGDTLTISNVTGLQNLWGGDDASLLTPIVEDGVPAYNMQKAGPRPFMDYAKELLLGGRADAALRRGLERQGIDTTGLTFIFE